jgi:ATP adenylyltransferase
MERGKVRRRRKTADTQTAILWAPWRRSYLDDVRRKTQRCIFCFGRLSAMSARRRLILFANATATVMLNRYPYAPGHLMIAPRRHVASPEMLEPAERAEMGEIIAAATSILRQSYAPEGINLGANLGRAAGAGFADHMHWHVVPRWAGDSNFITVIGAARVLSETLDEIFARLEPLFNKAVRPVS